MNNLKKLICAVALFTAPLAHGAVILETNAGGELTGARNIDIDGTLYDVTFRDGSFTDVFGSSAGMDVTVRLVSSNYSQALLDQVIAGTSFDSDPETILGCNNIYQCDIITPYDVFIHATTGVESFQAYFARVRFDSNGRYSFNTNGVPTSTDLSASDTQVFADWSLSSASASVPMPAPFLLFTLGAPVIWRTLRSRRS